MVKPVLAFDTSGINELTNEADFGALAAGLTTGYYVRLTGSNISELAATRRPEQRQRLLNTCKRFLTSGDCIDPFNGIVEKHTKVFDRGPGGYDWKSVDVRNVQLEQEIARRDLIEDDLAKLQREDTERAAAEFESIFCNMCPGFDVLFSRAEQPVERPATFADFVRVLQQPGGAFWLDYAHKFYARNVKDAPDETKVRDFAHRCPPFLMMVLAAVMAQYTRAILAVPEEKRRAGRVDLLTSAYLPYCSVFVTNDRDQARRLREVAAVANLNPEILWYGEFRNRLVGTIVPRSSS